MAPPADAPAFDLSSDLGLLLMFCYPAAILSFLGGIWWGFAMRRDRRRGPLTAVAVVPSLAAVALLWTGVVGSIRPALIGLGLALLLTLPVDWWLERAGDAPPGWLRFRAVLSGGLGLLTMAASLFAQPR